MAKVLMIAGGGTGGHIYPAIAIAQEFVSRGEGRNVIFVGTERGLEARIRERLSTLRARDRDSDK